MTSASFTPKVVSAYGDYRHNSNTVATSLKTCNTCNYQNNSLDSNSAQLHLNGHNVCLDKAISKNIYKEVHSKVEIILNQPQS